MFRVPQAQGDDAPVWPLPGVSPKIPGINEPTWRQRHFGAKRPANSGNPTRHHVGIDLAAPHRSLVVVPESGTLVNAYHFYSGTWALIFQTDTGIVINFGEVEPDSWLEFGVTIGTWLGKGEPIARVGRLGSGKSMLHIETYRRGTHKNVRWIWGSHPPDAILDPTAYLVDAAGRDAALTDDLDNQLPSDPGPGDDAFPDFPENPEVDPTIPSLPDPLIPTLPQTTTPNASKTPTWVPWVAGGLLVMGLLLLKPQRS